MPPAHPVKSWPTGAIAALVLGLAGPLHAQLRVPTREPRPTPTVQPFERCATCDYAHAQFQRLRAGLPVVRNPQLVPDDFWDAVITSRSGQREAVALWPTIRNVHSSRTDDDGDGLRECRIRIDLSPLVTLGGYPETQRLLIEEEARKALALWNVPLASVGLEFREVTSGEHLTLSAVNGGFAGRATLFGAFVINEFVVFDLSYTQDYYGAYHHLVEPATRNVVLDRPAGNPYAHLVDPALLTGQYWYPTITTLLHEIGHLVGLLHTWEGVIDAVQGGPQFTIDWLAYPDVDTPAGGFAPSTNIGGEDVLAGLFSRGLNNSYMTYDRPYYMLYPAIPPLQQAYLAHYYTNVNPAGAAALLANAIAEQQAIGTENRPGFVQEVEPNDTAATAPSIVPGAGVLGASSRWDPLGPDQANVAGDGFDFFSFSVTDVSRTFHFDLDHGSYLAYWQLAVVDTNGATILRSRSDAADYPGPYPDPGSPPTEILGDGRQDPYLVWTATLPGTYYIRVRRLTGAAAYGEYFLQTSPPIAPGDANLDGRIDGDDIAAFLAVITGDDDDPYRYSAADVNLSRVVDDADAAALANLLLGL